MHFDSCDGADFPLCDLAFGNQTLFGSSRINPPDNSIRYLNVDVDVAHVQFSSRAFDQSVLFGFGDSADYRAIRIDSGSIRGTCCFRWGHGGLSSRVREPYWRLDIRGS